MEIDFSSFFLSQQRGGAGLEAHPLHHRVATGQFLFLIIFNTVMKIIFQLFPRQMCRFFREACWSNELNNSKINLHFSHIRIEWKIKWINILFVQRKNFEHIGHLIPIKKRIFSKFRWNIFPLVIQPRWTFKRSYISLRRCL